MIGDFLLSMVLIVVATIVRIDTASYPAFSRTVAVGPGVFPNMITWFFYAAAAILLLKLAYKVFIKKTDSLGASYVAVEQQRVTRALGKVKESPAGLLGTLGVIGLMIFYAVFLKRIGFEICTVLFVSGTMLCCGERKISRLILLPLGSMLAVMVVFKMILKVALPMKLFINF